MNTQNSSKFAATMAEAVKKASASNHRSLRDFLDAGEFDLAENMLDVSNDEHLEAVDYWWPGVAFVDEIDLSDFPNLAYQVKKIDEYRSGDRLRAEVANDFGGSIDGLELVNNKVYSAITHDASEPGKIRATYYDHVGTSGHSTYETFELALDDLIHQGFLKTARGSFDRLQKGWDAYVSPQVSKGSEAETGRYLPDTCWTFPNDSDYAFGRIIGLNPSGDWEVEIVSREGDLDLIVLRDGDPLLENIEDGEIPLIAYKSEVASKKTVFLPLPYGNLSIPHPEAFDTKADFLAAVEMLDQESVSEVFVKTIDKARQVFPANIIKHTDEMSESEIAISTWDRLLIACRVTNQAQMEVYQTFENIRKIKNLNQDYTKLLKRKVDECWASPDKFSQVKINIVEPDQAQLEALPVEFLSRCGGIDNVMALNDFDRLAIAQGVGKGNLVARVAKMTGSRFTPEEFMTARGDSSKEALEHDMDVMLDRAKKSKDASLIEGYIQQSSLDAINEITVAAAMAQQMGMDVLAGEYNLGGVIINHLKEYIVGEHGTLTLAARDWIENKVNQIAPEVAPSLDVLLDALVTNSSEQPSNGKSYERDPVKAFDLVAGISNGSLKKYRHGELVDQGDYFISTGDKGQRYTLWREGEGFVCNLTESAEFALKKALNVAQGKTVHFDTELLLGDIERTYNGQSAPSSVSDSGIEPTGAAEEITQDFYANELLGFGKYRTLALGEVADKDIEYLVYLHDKNAFQKSSENLRLGVKHYVDQYLAVRQARVAEEDAQWVPEPDLALSFGKYQGIKVGHLHRLDIAYLQWLENSGAVDRLDAPLQKTISHYLTLAKDARNKVAAEVDVAEEIELREIEYQNVKLGGSHYVNLFNVPYSVAGATIHRALEHEMVEPNKGVLSVEIEGDDVEAETNGVLKDLVTTLVFHEGWIKPLRKTLIESALSSSINSDVKPVSDRVDALIQRGENFGIAQEVLDDQKADIANICANYESESRVYLLANEAGTGKTMVLGGVVDELKQRNNSIDAVYVTLNKDLIEQVKNDLADYDIEDVRFFSYADLRENKISDVGSNTLLIFDEVHAIENMESMQGASAQSIVSDAGFVIAASATAFRNPARSIFLGAAGLFDVEGLGATAVLPAFGVQVERFKGRITGYRWSNDTAAAKDFNDWLVARNIISNRELVLPNEQTLTSIQKTTISPLWKERYERVDGAVDELLSNSRLDSYHSQFKDWRQNIRKRIMEAATLPYATLRAMIAIEQGRFPVIYTESRSERHVGMWRRENGSLASSEEVITSMAEWEREKLMGGVGRPPFSRMITLLATEFYHQEIDFVIPGALDTIRGIAGDDLVATYSGEVSEGIASKNLQAWRNGDKRLLHATIAKGGTGLTLHDKIGNHQTTQIVNVLPWEAREIDQVLARTARYGLVGTAEIELMFAPELPIQHILVERAAQRLKDLGATLKNKDSVIGQKMTKELKFDQIETSDLSNDALLFSGEVSITKYLEEHYVNPKTFNATTAIPVNNRGSIPYYRLIDAMRDAVITKPSLFKAGSLTDNGERCMAAITKAEAALTSPADDAAIPVGLSKKFAEKFKAATKTVNDDIHRELQRLNAYNAIELGTGKILRGAEVKTLDVRNNNSNDVLGQAYEHNAAKGEQNDLFGGEPAKIISPIKQSLRAYVTNPLADSVTNSPALKAVADQVEQINSASPEEVEFLRHLSDQATYKNKREAISTLTASVALTVIRNESESVPDHLNALIPTPYVDPELNLAKKVREYYKTFIAAPDRNTVAPEHKAGVEVKPLDESAVLDRTAADEREYSLVDDNQLIEMPLDEQDFLTLVDTYGDLMADADERVRATPKDGEFITQEEAKARLEEWKESAKAQFSDPRVRNENNDKWVLSLFDRTGKWAEPWREAGYNVLTFDIQNDTDLSLVDADYMHQLIDQQGITDVYHILIATPCTDFASSGARWMSEKDADGRTEASKHLVFQAMKVVEFFKPKGGWALENPRGRIERLTNLPKARYTFDPNNFGEDYTKETTLWGNFHSDLPIANVEPNAGSKMHREFGGKSIMTKNARSETPEGFAWAYFVANNYEGLTPEKKLLVDFRENKKAISKALEVGLRPDAVRELVALGYGDEEYHLNGENLLCAYRAVKEGMSPADVSNILAQEIKVYLKEKTINDTLEGFPASLDAAFSREHERMKDINRDNTDTPNESKTTEELELTETPDGAGVIKDTGYIPGAAKERWAEMRRRYERDLTDEEIKSLSMSQAFPMPDFDKLLEGGVDAKALAAVAVLREGIGTKPRRMGPNLARKYIEKIRVGRELTADILSGSLPFQILENVLQEQEDRWTHFYAKYLLMTQLPERFIKHTNKIHVGSLHGYGGKAYQIGALERASMFDMSSKATADDISELANLPESVLDKIIGAVDKRIEKENANRKGNKGKGPGFKIELFSRKTAFNTYFFAGIKSAGREPFKYREAPAEFDRKQAREWFSENHDRWAEELVAKKSFKLRRKVNEDRIGPDWRQGRDITAEELQERFGLRAVQFGNTLLNNQKEAQEHINHAFDGLSDLAHILNLPKEAIGLEGSLGLAFGSRGIGGPRAAMAHYEPVQVVINLTRKNGSGSLAHEWWHALDNYLAKLRTSRSGAAIASLDRVSLSFQSDLQTPQSGNLLRAPIAEAIGDLREAISGSPLEEASIEMDALVSSSKPYWSTMIEMTARSFEAYIHKKMYNSDMASDYLVNLNIEPDDVGMGSVVPNYHTLKTLKIEAAFDSLLDNLQYDKEAAHGVSLFKKEYDFTPVLAVWQDAAKADEGLFRYPKYTGKTLQAIADETGAILKRDDKIAAMMNTLILAKNKTPVTDAYELITMNSGDSAWVYENETQVWVDMEAMSSGQSMGSEIYQMVADYALNTGKTLIGDPSGLTPVAVVRRTEAMVSSALKHGTTQHFQVAKEQKTAAGTDNVKMSDVESLEWSEDDAQNMAELLRVSYTNVVNHIPEVRHVEYDYERAEFVVKSGVSDSGGVIGRLVEYLNRRPSALRDLRAVFGRELTSVERALAGSATIKRAVITQSLLSAANEATGRPDLAGHVRELFTHSARSLSLSGVLYRKDLSPASLGAQVAKVREWVKPIEEATGVDVMVVATVEDLPVPIANSLGGNSPAVYDTLNKVPYIIADRIRSERQAKECALHEGLGHSGVISFIERNQAFGGAEFNHLLDQMFEDLDPADIRAKTAAYGFDFSKARDRREAVLEYIAHLAETGEKPQEVDQVMLSSRTMFNESTGVHWTYNDVLELIETSRLFVLQERMTQSAASEHDPKVRAEKREELFSKVLESSSERFQKLMQGRAGPMVYHGAGETFDRFDHSLMGTGVGGKSMGWGHYLTDNPDLADHIGEVVGGESGVVMNVALPLNTYNLLDLKKPLSEQSQYVKDMLAQAGMYDDTLSQRYSRYQADLDGAIENEDDDRLQSLLNANPGEVGAIEWRRGQMDGAKLYASIVDDVMWNDNGWALLLSEQEQESATNVQQMAAIILNKCGIRGAHQENSQGTYYVIYDEDYTPIVVDGKPLHPISDKTFLRQIQADRISQQGLTPIHARRDIKQLLEESVLVDDKMQPIPVYRGDDGIFNAQQTSTEGNWGAGSYWFTDRSLALDFGDRITTAYAAIRNPWRVQNAWDSNDSDEYDFDAPSIEAIRQLGVGETLIQQAKVEGRWFNQDLTNHLISLGYDGIIAENPDGTAEIVAFEPEQVVTAEYCAGTAPDLLRDAATLSGVSTPEPTPNTQSPAFRDWFAKSAMVDGSHQPLVMYHGTRADFDEFGKIGERNPFSRGYYFTSSEGKASVYADGPTNFSAKWNPESELSTTVEDGANVMPVYLSIQKPLRIRRSESPWNIAEEAFDNDYGAFVEAAKAAGFDGILFEADYDAEEGLEQTVDAVVFDNTQIKSAIGNVGSYSPRSANILEKRVYHGSPYQFDQFSLERSGTQFGANSFYAQEGLWGLHFATDKAVADWYRQTGSLAVQTQNTRDRDLLDEMTKCWAAVLRVYAPEHKAWQPFRSMSDYVAAYRDAVRMDRNYYEQHKDAIEAQITKYKEQILANNPEKTDSEIEAIMDDLGLLGSRRPFSHGINEIQQMLIRSREGQVSNGYLYESDIPTASLLNWDEAVSALQTKMIFKGMHDHGWMTEDLEALWDLSVAGGKETGGHLYGMIRQAMRYNDEQTAKLFARIGIPGVVTQNTKGREEFVIWDASRVTIESVNDQRAQAAILGMTGVMEDVEAYRLEQGGDLPRTRENRVYHGSSHPAKELSLDNVATGYRQPVQGWGIHLVDNRAAADGMRLRMVPKPLIVLDGVVCDESTLTDSAMDRMLRIFQKIGNGLSELHTPEAQSRVVMKQSAKQLADMIYDTSRHIKRYETVIAGSLAEGESVDSEINYLENELRPELAQLEEVKSLCESFNLDRLSWYSGSFYEAVIPDETQLLDLDLPISEQGDVVNQALSSIGFQLDSEILGSDVYKLIIQMAETDWRAEKGPVWESVLQDTSVRMTAALDEVAARYLASIGIGGAVYSTSHSLTRNYLMWDADAVKTERAFGHSDLALPSKDSAATLGIQDAFGTRFDALHVGGGLDPDKNTPMDYLARQKAIKRLESLIGSSVSIDAAKLPAEFVEQGHLTLIGQVVDSGERLAMLSEIYRDPRFETLRVFYTKDNEIVGQSAVTSYLPSAVSFDRQDVFSTIAEQINTTGADGYWLLHNHPSGNPEPSPADLDFTKACGYEVPGLAGHIIINGDRFASLKYHESYHLVKSEIHQCDLTQRSYSLTDNPLLNGSQLGCKIKEPRQIVEMAQTIRDERDNIFNVIGTSADLKVNAVLSYSVPAFLELASRIPVEEAWEKFTKNIGKTLGSESVFVVANPSMYLVLDKLILEGLVMDAVIREHSGQYTAVKKFKTSQIIEHKKSKLSPLVSDSDNQAAKYKVQEPLNQRLVDSPLRALAGTKVVNQKGEPSVLYRGGMTRFNSDAITVGNSYGGAYFGRGVYMTTSAQDASRYASSDVSVNWDITGKAQALNAMVNGELTHTEAKAQVTGDGFVTPLYANLKNPMVFHTEPVKFTEPMFRLAAAECDVSDVSLEESGLTLSKLYTDLINAKSAREQIDLMMVKPTVFRSLATMMNHDGLVVTSVAMRMRDQDTVHVIAFDESQVIPATYYNAARAKLLPQPNENVAFREWFADSVVRTSSGEPVVVYHGTEAPMFDVFRESGGRNGFAFSESKQAAEVIAGPNGHVVQAYLSINSPVDLSDDPEAWEKFDNGNSKYISDLKASGYDGAILKMPKDDYYQEGDCVYIAFNPEQVKSATANIGNYDPLSRNYLRKIEVSGEQQINSELLVGVRTDRLDEYRLKALKHERMIRVEDAITRLNERLSGDVPELVAGQIRNLLLAESTRPAEVTATMLDWMSSGGEDYIFTRFREINRMLRAEIETLQMAMERVAMTYSGDYVLNASLPIALQSKPVQNALKGLELDLRDTDTGYDALTQLYDVHGNGGHVTDLLVAAGVHSVQYTEMGNATTVLLNETPITASHLNNPDDNNRSHLSALEQNLWRSAERVGLDMSDDARMSRAEMLGFRTTMPVLPVAQMLDGEYQRSDDGLYRFYAPRNPRMVVTEQQAFLSFNNPLVVPTYRDYLEVNPELVAAQGFDAAIWIGGDDNSDSAPSVAVAVIEGSQVANTQASYIAPMPPAQKVAAMPVASVESAIYFPASGVGIPSAVPRIGPAGSGVYFSTVPAVAEKLTSEIGGHALQNLIRDVDDVLKEKLGVIAPKQKNNQPTLARGKLLGGRTMTIGDQGVLFEDEKIGWRDLVSLLRQSGINDAGAVIGYVVGQKSAQGAAFVKRLNLTGDPRTINRLAATLGADIVRFDNSLPGLEGHSVSMAVNPEVILPDGAVQPQSHLPRLLAKLEQNATADLDLGLEQLLTHEQISRAQRWIATDFNFNDALHTLPTDIAETFDSYVLEHPQARIEVAKSVGNDYALLLDAYGPEGGAFGIARIFSMQGNTKAIMEQVAQLKTLKGVDVLYMGTNASMSAETRWLVDQLGAYSSSDGGRFISVSERAQGRERCSVRHLFAGEGARTADLEKLKEARKITNGNRLRDAAWERTGWFKGADGQWRFELSDAEARWTDKATQIIGAVPQDRIAVAVSDIDAANTRFQTILKDLIDDAWVMNELNSKTGGFGMKFQDLHGCPELVRSMNALYVRLLGDDIDRKIKYETTHTLTEDHAKQRIENAFTFALKQASSLLNKASPVNGKDYPLVRLGDMLTHNELYKAYPGMSDVWLKVAPADKDYNGSFIENTHIGPVVVVSGNGTGADAMLSTLLHEIQHGIQSVEGFARGGDISANTKNWAEKKLKNQLEEFVKSFEYREYEWASENLSRWRAIENYAQLLAYKSSPNITRVARHIVAKITPDNKGLIHDLYGARPRRHQRVKGRRWLESVALFVLNENKAKFADKYREDVRVVYKNLIKEDGQNAVKNGISRATRRFYKSLQPLHTEERISMALRNLSKAEMEFRPAQTIYRKLSGEVEARAVQNRLKNPGEHISKAFDLPLHEEIAVAVNPNPSYREYMLTKSSVAGANIHILNGVEDMPSEILDSPIADGRPSAGATVGGEVYVDGSRDDVEQVVAHELAHVAVKQAFGPTMSESYSRFWVGIGQEQGMRGEAAEAGFSMDAYLDATARMMSNQKISPSERIEILVDEFVAHAVEHRVNEKLSTKAKRLTKEFIGAARNALSKRGWKFNEVTQADVAYTIKIVNRAVKNGEDPDALPDLIAKRGGAEKMERAKRRMATILARLVPGPDSACVEMVADKWDATYPVASALVAAQQAGCSLDSKLINQILRNEYACVAPVSDMATEAFEINLRNIEQCLERGEAVESKEVLLHIVGMEDMMQRIAKEYEVALYKDRDTSVEYDDVMRPY